MASIRVFAFSISFSFISSTAVIPECFYRGSGFHTGFPFTPSGMTIIIKGSGVMLDLLKKINLFENLSEPELEKILPLCLKQSFAAGTVIFKEGDPGDRCYIITSGAVRISKF